GCYGRLPGVRVDQVVQFGDDGCAAPAVDGEALVGPDRQQTQGVAPVRAARLNTEACGALRKRHAETAIAWQTAQGLIVRAEGDAERRLVAAKELERVRLIGRGRRPLRCTRAAADEI